MNRIVLASRGIVLATMLAWLPLPAFAADSGSGMELYNKKCSMCHGKDGVAKKMAEGSADLNDAEWQKATSVDAIAGTIAEGKGKMPEYRDKLTADEIKAIAEYILTLK